NPNHRWYYIPHQRKEEVLLLKCYDSDGRHSRFTAHSAFEDPSSPPNAAPRESIEVRTLVFFAPEVGA
ncbi:MAG TPA: CmcJ/NvfI family oxidoreductase, partial [Candidatus Acidoferrales bacterium]|nr:CmcJ/NvfI family oxidoreductase [Candidatus Acidoferrales bacterium]